MSFCILRTAKLKTFANISGSARHNFRERHTQNADPERTPSNISSGAQSSKEVIAAIKARLETVPNVRKNAVLALEYFIGASPEFFKEKDPKIVEAYFDSAERWLKDLHGAANVISVTRQYDETSPHICVYVVPIDQQGKLNCSAFLDGREKLSLMQTDFAEKCGKPFQLERGIEGSKATHKTIKQYYAEIQKPFSDEITITSNDLKPIRTKTGGLLGKFGVVEEETAQGIAQRLTELVRDAYKPAVSSARQHHIEKPSKDAREQRLRELRATATRARELQLESVLECFGCERDYNDKKNWRTPAGRVTVNAAKFYCHDLQKGGGGAIDLVMMLEETDYEGAVNCLAREFGSDAVLEDALCKLKEKIEVAAEAPPRPFRAPEPNPENWPKVRQYLTEARRLSGELVDRLHELGKVYADRYSNAVFVLGKGVGVELRGTGEKPFHGVRGEKAPFIMVDRGEKAPFIMADRGEKKVAFVESSIDAISLWELGFKGRIVSMSGNSAELAKEKAKIYREQGLTVVAAFDKDRAGEQMAANLGYPRERLYPEGKDWNDDLKSQRQKKTEFKQDVDRGLEF